MEGVRPATGIHEFLLGRDSRLAALVERHRDRTMTVVSLSGTEKITRCGTCPKEDSRPCRALRLLALPYAHHPAYQPEWHVAVPESSDGAAGEGWGSGL